MLVITWKIQLSNNILHHYLIEKVKFFMLFITESGMYTWISIQKFSDKHQLMIQLISFLFSFLFSFHLNTNLLSSELQFYKQCIWYKIYVNNISLNKINSKNKITKLLYFSNVNLTFKYFMQNKKNLQLFIYYSHFGNLRP